MTENNKKEIIALTKQLVSYRTTYTRPKDFKRCVAFLRSYFKGLPVRITSFDSNGVPSLLILPKKINKPKLLLNGHFDVVEGNNPQFRAVVKGNKLIGRGSVDMKSQVAAMMVLIKEALRIDPNASVGLMLVGDEELGGNNGTKYLLSKGVAADFVIAGEPSDLRIASEAKGIMNIELQALGKSAHSARPWQGNNAIVKLTHSIKKITDRYPIPSEEKNADTTSYSVTLVSGGEVLNKIPASARASLNIRYIPKESPRSIVANLKKIMGPGIRIKILSIDPAAFCHKKNRDLQRLAEVITKVTKKKARIVRKAAGSDVRHFTAAGIPGVVFGPSGGGSAHSDHEWVDLKSLFQFYEILERFLTRS